MASKRITWALVVGLLAVLGSGGPALAQFVSGSDGSDGVFNPLANVEVAQLQKSGNS